MAKGVRIQPVIPQQIYDQLVAKAKESGLSHSQIIANLIHTYLPKVHIRVEKPIDPKRRYNELVKQIKPYVDKVNAGTITRTELVAMDPISREICEVRQLMGMESGYVDRVAQFDKNRAEAEATIHQMEHELEQLQTLSRQSPLDDVDTYRARELLGLIKQYRYDLDVDYPL